VIHRLGDTVKPEPTLVSAMIGLAIYDLELQAFWERWCDGRWSDPQLEEFQVERCRIFASWLSTNSIITAESFNPPFHYLSSIALPNTYRAIQTVARNQTALHQAMLVCALERYRRARGNYPADLDALRPDFIQKPPHDLITGQPLRYRRTDDGKFLLYSVGWNERDDAGLPDKDREKGDWVWPTAVKE
jgi:hypothetical protein